MDTMGVLYFFFCDATNILYTDVQEGAIGHVAVKYSNIGAIVMSSFVLSGIPESPERETAFARRS